MQTTAPRRVLVTGAAGGIRRAVCALLSGAGRHVLGVDAAATEPQGGATFVVADLATHDGNAAAVRSGLDRLGGLDAVVAGAGLQHVDSVERFPEERWERLLAVMLTTPFLLAKYAWAQLASSGAGRFIALGSAHRLVASPFKAGYVAAKHGLSGLVKTIALEGAGVGIAAICLAPGCVRTTLIEEQIAAQARAHGLDACTVLGEVLLAPPAIKRLLEPEEVAAGRRRAHDRPVRGRVHRCDCSDGSRLDGTMSVRGTDRDGEGLLASYDLPG
jgi:3-hydroxybutyrate dehydrogenase